MTNHCSIFWKNANNGKERTHKTTTIILKNETSRLTLNLRKINKGQGLYPRPQNDSYINLKHQSLSHFYLMYASWFIFQIINHIMVHFLNKSTIHIIWHNFISINTTLGRISIISRSRTFRKIRWASSEKIVDLPPPFFLPMSFMQILH